MRARFMVEDNRNGNRRSRARALWILLAVLTIGPSPGGSPASAATSISQWSPHDIVLKSSKTYSNPFRGVQVFADFVSPSGRPLRVYGFYDGDRAGGQGDRWVIRFMGDEVGEWYWVTEASDTSNSGLHNRSGSLNVVESSNPGPVAPSPESPTSWEHANGERVLWNLGYSPFMAAADRTHPTVGGWQDYLDWLRLHRFNGAPRHDLPAAAVPAPPAGMALHHGLLSVERQLRGGRGRPPTCWTTSWRHGRKPETRTTLPPQETMQTIVGSIFPSGRMSTTSSSRCRARA